MSLTGIGLTQKRSTVGHYRRPGCPLHGNERGAFGKLVRFHEGISLEAALGGRAQTIITEKTFTGKAPN